MGRMSTGSNPILRMDFPDPDIIFADGVYYMISTTMHFLPGGQILRSYDLLNWEHAAYVFDLLDSTPAQCLQEDKYVYGKGMWAASLRYHKGTFYVAFVCNDTQKTYLYRAEKIEGPWRKSEISGFYHDCSLLFDDDDRVYVVYGNRQIYLTELDADLRGPKEGGLNRLLLQDSEKTPLGYEGSHLYKINGRYYLFMIHSLEEKWRRVEACFSSDSLEGDFTGGDVFNDDMGFRNSGIAQGGIVCGADGVWNAVLFQDSGAIGRIPVVVPMTWEDDRPVFGIDGKAPSELTLPVSDACLVAEEACDPLLHETCEDGYAPLAGSDDFKYGFTWEEGLREDFSPDFKRKFGCFGMRSFWQFNHEPDLRLVYRDEQSGKFWITSDKLSLNINHAKNTITQRMIYPSCAAEVTIDCAHLSEGDCAGLVALQGDYCWVGVERRDGKLFEVMYGHKSEEGPWDLSPVAGTKLEEREAQVLRVSGKDDEPVKVRMEVLFENEKDEAVCLTDRDGSWQNIGKPHKLRFRLDHFTGARFGLFMYSTKVTEGKAGFSDFRFFPGEKE